MRIETLALGLALLTACGTSIDDPTPTPPPVTEPQPEPEPEPEPIANWLPPPTWGSSVLEDTNEDPNVVEVSLRAQPMRIDLTDEVGFEGYGYNGEWPGPTLHAKVGDEVIVHFRNDLTEPTTVHWHGLRIPDDMDGSPRIQDPVQPGETFTYRFVVPDAGTYWYHPHVRSNEQVEKGLYGSIIIREKDMPEFDAERVFVLDDIAISGTDLAPFLQSHPEMVHGRNGNMLLINGKVDPAEIEVKRNQTELWRIVNTANARTMTLSVQGARTIVLGTDGGRLAEPYVADRLEMPVGQRYDLLVVYDEPGVARFLSHVLTLDANNEVVEVPFDLAAVAVAEESVTPRGLRWPALEARPERSIDREVKLELNGVNNGSGIEWMINGEMHPTEPLFTFEEGQTVMMTIENQAGPEHPFHLHGQFFEIVEPAQPGLKDTVLVPGFETVRIRAYLDNPGRWMAHCHILEHAELGMMSEIVVDPR